MTDRVKIPLSVVESLVGLQRGRIESFVSVNDGDDFVCLHNIIPLFRWGFVLMVNNVSKLLNRSDISYGLVFYLASIGGINPLYPKIYLNLISSQ